jgi:hypothetical protein
MFPYQCIEFVATTDYKIIETPQPNKAIIEFFSEFSLGAHSHSRPKGRERSGKGFHYAVRGGFKHIVFSREA